MVSIGLELLGRGGGVEKGWEGVKEGGGVGVNGEREGRE